MTVSTWGLLKHDLADPNGVRVICAAPGKIPALDPVPPDDSLDKIFMAQMAGKIVYESVLWDFFDN